MKKSFTVFITALFVLGVNGSFAKDKKEADTKPDKFVKIEGTVIAINTAAKTLTLKTETGEQTFPLADDPAVKRAKAKTEKNAEDSENAAMLSDIKAGCKIKAKYKIGDSSKTVKKITLIKQ